MMRSLLKSSMQGMAHAHASSSRSAPCIRQFASGSRFWPGLKETMSDLVNIPKYTLISTTGTRPRPGRNISIWAKR